MGIINNTKPSSSTSLGYIGVYIGEIYSSDDGISIGRKVNSTGDYGIHVADGVYSYDAAIYISKTTEDSNPVIKSNAGSGVYIEGSISANNYGVYVMDGISTTSKSGIYINGGGISSKQYGIYVDGNVTLSSTGSYSGIYIDGGITAVTGKYGIYVANGITSYDAAVCVNTSSELDPVINVTSGSGIYINGSISAKNNGVYVKSNIISTSTTSSVSGINVAGYVQGSGANNYPVVTLGGINANNGTG